MNTDPMREEFSSRQIFSRVAVLVTMTLGAFVLRLVDPASWPWFPLRTSCGAVTGLPCLFCGMTRAVHQLLNGNVSGALYFNWLAFPIAAMALAFAMNTGTELALGRRTRLAFPSVRFTPRFAAFGATCLVGLWVLQVSLAVTLHKRDLLNPNGVLYELIVR